MNNEIIQIDNTYSAFGSGFYYKKETDGFGDVYNIYKNMKISGNFKRIAQIKYDERLKEYKIMFFEWGSFSTVSNFFRDVPQIMSRVLKLGNVVEAEFEVK